MEWDQTSFSNPPEHRNYKTKYFQATQSISDSKAFSNHICTVLRDLQHDECHSPITMMTQEAKSILSFDGFSLGHVKSPTHQAQVALLLVGDLSRENASEDGKFSSEFKQVQSLWVTLPAKTGRAVKRGMGRESNRQEKNANILHLLFCFFLLPFLISLPFFFTIQKPAVWKIF